MADSTFVYEQGEAISVGSHGDHDFVFHEGDPVTDTGISDLVFEAGTGLGQAHLIWYSQKSPDKYHEIDYDTFSIVQSGDSPANTDATQGAGGVENTAWCFSDSESKFWELDSSISVVRTVQIGSRVYTCGGGSDSSGVLYAGRVETTGVDKIDAGDASILEQTGSLSGDGAGGKEDVAWVASNNPNSDGGTLRELDPNDLSTVQSRSYPTSQNAAGMGGSTEVCYYTESGDSGYWYELDTGDMSIIRQKTTDTSRPHGMGGV